MRPRREMHDYFNGFKLIGDDYDESEILEWYDQEKNAYANMVDSQEFYSYEYHALNAACGFRLLKSASSHSIRACGFGCALGDELQPIRDKIASTVLIDSATSFHESGVEQGVKRVLAQASGEICCDSGSFDLITCFGVLHHIPNVSFVMSELYRCLASGGVLMVREPTTSMGDWRVSRKGLTKNERGIPKAIFKDIILKAGFEILQHKSCVFPPLAAACRKMGISPYNSKFIVFLDLLLSRAFRFNYHYHRLRIIDKFSPACDFYVCQKY